MLVSYNNRLWIKSVTVGCDNIAYIYTLPLSFGLSPLPDDRKTPNYDCNRDYDKNHDYGCSHDYDCEKALFIRITVIMIRHNHNHDCDYDES